MRAAILIILIVALGGAGYFWLRSSRNGSGTANGDAAVRTAVVNRGNINFAVTVAGEIGPAEQVSVRPEVNGRISELPVDVGDRVKQGGLLFSLDDRDLRIEVETKEKQIESTRLQLDKARISMEQAERDYQRDRELFEAKLLAEQAFEATREQWQSASKDYDLARNSIERAQQDLLLSKERLQKTRIEAPFDCTVLTRPVSKGQAVSGSGGFNSGTEVLTIADLSSMVINAHVNQADVTRLRQGMEVLVEVDALPGVNVKGQVERIAPQATVRNNIKGYATRIQLKEVDERVQPGMTASISIPVAEATNVLTVPLSAVFTEPGERNQTERYVMVKVGEGYERRPVTVGVSDFFSAEITSGLNGGEEVALEPPEGAANRMPGGGPSVAQGGRPAANGSATAVVASTPQVTTSNAVATASASAASTNGRPAAARPGT